MHGERESQLFLQEVFLNNLACFDFNPARYLFYEKKITRMTVVLNIWISLTINTHVQDKLVCGGQI